MINLQTVFESIRSVVCLNGEIPNASFFLKYNHLPLIACDGAGSRLVSRGIYPNFIIGDLDSLDALVVPPEVQIIQTPDQNYTDFEKALMILAEKKNLPCLITGTTGRETDHTLYNINIILKYSREYQMLFHDSACTERQQFGVFVFDSLVGPLEEKTIISILPFPEATLSTKGLKWNLINETLSQHTKSSIRNVVHQSPIEISVQNGIILVMFECNDR